MPGQRSMACTASLACVHSEATTTCTGFTAMARCHTGLSSAPARRPDLYMWERGQGLQCRVWTGTARFLALRMRLCIQGGCWERLSAHVWVCPHAPPTQHRSDRGQRALPAAHRPYSGAPLTPWHAGCGIASQEQFPHAAPPQTIPSYGQAAGASVSSTWQQGSAIAPALRFLRRAWCVSPDLSRPASVLRHPHTPTRSSRP